MKKKEPELNFIVYTDPLCCWSWEFQPVIERIQSEMGSAGTWRYCMAGLIPDWQHFRDETQSVTRPQQMGPVWMHAAATCGRKINYRIWHTDPPASSIPACCAFKCAEKQSSYNGEVYLKNLWSAVMENGLNISNEQVLMAIAADQATNHQLDLTRFVKDFTSGKGRQLLNKDLMELRVRQIKRLPSLIISSHQTRAILIEGYREFQQLKSIIETISDHSAAQD